MLDINNFCFPPHSIVHTLSEICSILRVDGERIWYLCLFIFTDIKISENIYKVLNNDRMELGGDRLQ